MSDQGESFGWVPKEPFTPSLPPAEKLDRLPIWAFDLIRRYCECIDNWKAYARAARLDTNPDVSRIVLDPNAQTPIGLSTDQVTFRLGPVDRPVDKLDEIAVRLTRSDPSVIELIGRGRIGSNGLTISPVVSNVLRVRLARDW